MQSHNFIKNQGLKDECKVWYHLNLSTLFYILGSFLKVIRM